MNGVSIIICCFNSATRIVPTITCLKKQINCESINWEVILIDNNSTDKTVEFAKETWENLGNNYELKIISEKKVGQAFARSTGIEAAKYEIISFIDDDNWVPENWIKSIFEVFNADENIGVLGCNIVGKFETQPPDWIKPYLIAYAIGQLYNQKDVTNLGPVYGAGMCVRKSALDILKTKGWKPFLTGRSKEILLGGDDSELCFAIRQIGYKIFYDANLTITHFVPSFRLEKSYTLRLCEGFGNADLVLLAYRIAYAKKMHLESEISLFFKTSWLFQSIICVKRIIIDRVSWPFLGSEDPIKVKYDAFLKNLISDKGKLRSIVNQLIKL